MTDYRLYPITWKNVIDYNWLRLQLPHVWEVNHQYCWWSIIDWVIDQYFSYIHHENELNNISKHKWLREGWYNRGNDLTTPLRGHPLLSTIWDVLTSYTTQYPDDQYYLILTKMQNKIIIRKLSILMIVMLSRYITPEQYG
jgi:hypothetical protein